MTRKVEAFQQKFTDIAKICDGKINDMGAGAVDHWLDQVKAANDLYDKLYNEIPDTTVINFHEVSFPGEEGEPNSILDQWNRSQPQKTRRTLSR